MARSSLNVLHISDLHFGTTDNARTWYAKLAEDLRYELACFRLDAVIISGDIASKSNPDEYAAAQLFVNRLSQEFQLESHQIVIVPGNHDINWQISEAAYFRITSENSQQETEEYLTDEQGRFIGGTNPEQHKQRFINFSKFYEAIRGEVYPLDYEQQYTLQHLPEQKLLILGLNSAWQIDHINKRNLSINSEALSNALSLIRQNPTYEDCLKIAVWHHSLNSTFGDRITDSGVMERLAAAGFRFVLHGSVHGADNSSYHYDYSIDGKKIDIIGAGIFGISQNKQLSNYPWQYNFLKIEENKVTIETRKRDEVNGVWIPDIIWRRDSTEQLASRYVITLNHNNIQDYQLYFERGTTYIESGRFEQAIASFDKAIELKPNFHDAWNNRGLALLNLERYEQAIASFDKAIELKPDFHCAWFNRGLALLNLERYEQAIASFDKAIELKPDFHYAWNSLGLVLFELERYEQAIASFDKAIELKPDFHNAWFNRGLKLLNLERYEQAIASFDKALELKPDFHDTWNNRGLALLNLARYEEAIASIDKALELKPDFHNAWLSRGTAAGKSIAYNQFLHFPSAIYKNNAKLNQRGYQGKIISYQEGLKYCHQDTHPEGWGKLHLALGNAHYLQGEEESNPQSYWHQAVGEYYQALITLMPEAFPELYLEVIKSLVDALLGLGQIHEAEKFKQNGLDVLTRLLSSSLLSNRKKQQLNQRFSHLTQLADITQEKVIISYEISINISSEIILIGGEYQLTTFLNSRNNSKNNNIYLLEMPRDEAPGNELNIFLTAPGFHFNNDNTTSLPLDADTANITQTATFNLTALRPGKTKIQAELYVGETYKTTLETEVEVTAFEPTQLCPLIAARSRPVPQPSLILQVRTTWNADISACVFNYHIDSYQSQLLFTDNFDCASQSLSAIWVKRTQQLLKATLEDAANSQPGDFCSRLVSFGQYLFQSLFPEELQSTFRTIANLNHPFTLLIIADQDACFPWELFHDGKKFLGDRLIIGRWLWELEKARPYEFPVGAVNVAHYANVEQPELWNQLLYSSGAPPPIPMQAGIFNDMSLFESIRGLHLIRYSQSADAENRQNTPVRIDNGNDIGEIERELQPAKLSLRRNHPLVSLSYVNAGQIELTALEQTWASTFVKAGCSGFVGSLWAMQPDVEAAFTSAFYNSIWSGQTLAVAFDTARKLAKAVVPESSDWLAYVLFGDPMARPYRPAPGQGYAVVEPIGQQIDDPVAPGTTLRFRVSLRRTPPVWYENRLMEVAEDLTFDDLRVFIVTSGLQVTPSDSIIMKPTATGDYLGWFMLSVPPEMETRSVLVKVYFEDGIEPVHSLRFSLKIGNGEVEEV